MGSLSLEMQADPDEDEGPQQHREDRRHDRFQSVQMREIVMRRGHQYADGDVDDQEQPHPAAQDETSPSPRAEDRSAKEPHSRTPDEVDDRQDDQHDDEDANDPDPADGSKHAHAPFPVAAG